MTDLLFPGPWLETVEARAVRMFAEAASPATRATLGVSVREWGSAVGVRTARTDVLALNRVLALGWPEPASEAELDQMVEWFREGGVPRCFLQVAPLAEPGALRWWLGRRGLAHYNNWVKLCRSVDDLPQRPFAPRIEPLSAERAAAFGRAVATGFAWPDATAAWLAETVGRPGWRHYAAVDAAGALLGAAVLQIEGESAYVGFAATVAEHRGKGVQTALVIHRLHEARAAGCTRIVAETAEDSSARPAPSFRNLRRLGFEVSYLRNNYLWKAPGSAA